MKWFDIIKVEDIDFDKDLQAFGQYGEGIDVSNRQDMDKLMNKLIMSSVFQSKQPDIKDFVKEKIRINHVRIYDYLKEKLGREPTDKQLIDFITRTIMHEGTHAAMGSEQDSMAEHQAEYGAFTGQFPESTYIRLLNFVKHPATRRMLFPPELAAMFNMNMKDIRRTPDIIEKVEELLAYVDGITEDIPSGKSKDSMKEKLTRLEITARQKGEPIVREWPHQNIKEYYRFALKRYGDENKELLDTLARANGLDPNELKAAMAVTTTSAPTMFNRKVVRGRKKKKRDD
tara:strand:+ start:1696 stop:2556 length:861 start_codon:yes stop_codon:yes gene_type:complete